MLLSVCIRTYNQEHFIKQALESVLMQRTSFPFEIIISDDCSTDETRSILIDYESRFPDRIRLFLNNSNGGGPRNLRRVIEESDAKYITCLDGDDYYIDRYKLQKQVEFLEDNENYVACFHNVMNVYENSSKRSLFLPLDFPDVATAYDVISKPWFLPIHSVMMRREFISFPNWYETVMNDDYVVNLSIAMYGPYYYMPDIMAAYRHHGLNISNNYSDQILIDSQLRTILAGFKKIYPVEYASTFDERILFFDKRIAFNQRERKQPWRKFFRIKTYKRLLKRILFRKPE